MDPVPPTNHCQTPSQPSSLTHLLWGHELCLITSLALARAVLGGLLLTAFPEPPHEARCLRWAPTSPAVLPHTSVIWRLCLRALSSGDAEGKDFHPHVPAGWGWDPTFPVCPSQCAAVYLACAATGRAGMEAACASLDTLDPAVTAVSSCWASTPHWPEQDGTSACSPTSF